MFQLNKLLIIGVGLIGGSLALALRKAGAVREIVGAGRTLESLEKAVELGVIDRFTRNITEEVPGSDVVVVATPVLSFDAMIQTIAQSNYHNSIVTDVGSVKKQIEESAERHFSTDYSGFIGAHPIAGAEHSGVSAAFADLFHGKRTILTPTDRTGDEAVETVRNMWITAGSVVSDMDVNLHDDLVAASSHLPHLVAFSLVHYIANHQSSRECFDLAASGFYDFTRIASSDATMWHDISMANSEAIARELEGYINELSAILRSVTNRDSATLEKILTTAKSTRDRNLALWQDNGSQN